ncbi:hypothetical protein ACEPWQ_18825 [Leclercia adecarboxylata]|jgi:hypothetical protein|uniref:hypothetical protein n=1 Tax=Leclercia adecarboxylata TaxID=83655 RepID=UPI0025B1905E|nr:hypothetical protein [Leclercia adecarboxylata]WJT02485.1 hypothetical protein OCT50_18080 [Leclercia adecarboxylata]
MTLKTSLEIFADGPGNAHIYILHFPCLVGIKRGARLIQKKHTTFLRVATSSRVKQ